MGRRPPSRKGKPGNKTPIREVIRRIFQVLSDGKRRSTTQIAREAGICWITAYWALYLIAYIQSQPTVRVEKHRRKMFFQMARVKRVWNPSSAL